MINNFAPPQKFTFEGKTYVFQFQRNINDKGEKLPSMHYYYKIDNKGNILPTPEKQLKWMLGVL